MKTIITGGSGLIGRPLASELCAAGHEVVVLSRNPERVHSLPERTRVVRWDGRSGAGWGGEANGADAIVNLAGENIAGGRWSTQRKLALRSSRVDAGLAVLDAMRRVATPPRVLIQSSAVGYYGDTGAKRVGEEAAPASDFLGGLCQEWEDSTRDVEALGTRRAVIRSGIVLSTAGGALPRLLLPFRLFAGGPIGGGHQGFPWIHVADEVGAIRFLIERGDAQGAFNLAAPNAPSNREFARALGRVLGRPAFMPAPAVILKLLFGEMSNMLLSGQYALPTKLQQLGYPYRFPTLDGALRDLLR